MLGNGSIKAPKDLRGNEVHRLLAEKHGEDLASWNRVRELPGVSKWV